MKRPVKYLVVSSVFSPSMLKLEEGEQTFVKFSRITLDDAMRLIARYQESDVTKICAASTEEMGKAFHRLFGLHGCAKRNVRVMDDTLMIVVIVKTSRNSDADEILEAVKNGNYAVFKVERY